MTAILRTCLEFFSGESPPPCHAQKYKNYGKDSEEMRQRRADTCNKNRSEKRNEQLCKNRNINDDQNCDENDDNDDQQCENNEESCENDEQNGDEEEDQDEEIENAMNNDEEYEEENVVCMDDIVTQLDSDEYEDKMQGMTQFIQSVNNNGKEAIDAGVECDVIPRLADIISDDGYDEDLQRESTCALRFISMGTKKHITAMIKADCITALICLLSSNNEAIVEHAVWALGGIATDTLLKHKSRMFIALTRMPLFVKRTRYVKCAPLLQALAWTMSRVQTVLPATCRKNFVPLMVKFIIYDVDAQFLNCACNLLSFEAQCEETNDILEQEDVIAQLVEALTYEDLSSVLLSLHVILKIVTESDEHTQCLRNENVLQVLGGLLCNPFPLIQRESARCMEVITGNMAGYSSDIIEYDVLATLIRLLSQTDDEVRKTIVNVLCNVVCDINADLTQRVIDGNFLQSLCEVLENCSGARHISSILISLMCFLEVAKSFHQLDEAVEVIEECGGLDVIKALRKKKSKIVSLAATKLMKLYFRCVVFREQQNKNCCEE